MSRLEENPRCDFQEKVQHVAGAVACVFMWRLYFEFPGLGFRRVERVPAATVRVEAAGVDK